MFDTIFLDRDGTINGDPLGYINSLSDYHFYDYTELSQKQRKYAIKRWLDEVKEINGEYSAIFELIFSPKL